MAKFQDMKMFYSLVERICCFDSPSSSEADRLQLIKRALTRGLPDEFYETDFKMFRIIYCDYRMWILRQYIDPFYSFSAHYHPARYYHPRNGFETSKHFKEEYGELAELYIFLATSLANYFENQFESFRSSQTDSSIDMTLFGEVAHKMYYGSLLLKHQIGYRNLDSALEWELRIIKNKRGHKERILKSY